YLLWNINNAGKAQLIDIEGNKFSGTPNLDKLTKMDSLPIVRHDNGTDYIVTEDNKIISTATGIQAFKGEDKSTSIQRERIIAKTRGGNVINTQENVIEETPKPVVNSTHSFTYGGITIPT